MMSSRSGDSGLEVWIKIQYGDILLLHGFESRLCQLSILLWQRPAATRIPQSHSEHMPSFFWGVCKAVTSVENGQVVDELNIASLMVKLDRDLLGNALYSVQRSPMLW